LGTAPWGCRTTTQAACQIGFRAGAAARAAAERVSGSHFQAKATLSRQSPAAIRPGAAWPQWAAKDPSTGPIMSPTAVAEDSQPSARARSLGATESAT
jgi:hypothetical protein